MSKKVDFAILDAEFAEIEGISLIQRMILSLTSRFPEGMKYNNIELAKFFQIKPDRMCHLIKELLDLEFLIILKRQSRHREVYLNKEHPTLVKIAEYHKSLLRCKQPSRNCLHCYLQRSTLAFSPNSIKRSKGKDYKDEEKVFDKTTKHTIDSKTLTEPQVSSVEFMDLWNSHRSLPKIHTFTDQRKRALATRGKEPGFADNWRLIIDKLSSSPFHTGQNNRKWRADVDWLLKNDTNYIKILELAELIIDLNTMTHECTEAEADRLLEYCRKNTD